MWAMSSDCERRNLMKRMVILTSFVVGLVLMPRLGSQRGRANGDVQGEDYTALLKVLSNSKRSLAEGIRQAAKSTEVPISAKFELDDNGKLSLSVYTAENGLTTDAEHNVL